MVLLAWMQVRLLWMPWGVQGRSEAANKGKKAVGLTQIPLAIPPQDLALLVYVVRTTFEGIFQILNTASGMLRPAQQRTCCKSCVVRSSHLAALTRELSPQVCLSLCLSETPWPDRTRRPAQKYR